MEIISMIIMHSITNHYTPFTLLTVRGLPPATKYIFTKRFQSNMDNIHIPDLDHLLDQVIDTISETIQALVHNCILGRRN